FSSRRRHTRFSRDWSSDVCSSDLELRLANLALDWGKPVVMAINKWDLVTDEQLRPFTHMLNERLEPVSFAPRVFTSAETDFGLRSEERRVGKQCRSRWWREQAQRQ